MPKQAPQRILLAEDSDDLRVLLQACLEAAGFDVTACRDGRHAFQIASHGEPLDLLVSDIQMPHLSGDSLALAMSGLRPGLPVLLMSGAELQPHLQRLIAERQWAFLAKPFRLPEMMETVRALVGREVRMECAARWRVG